MSNLPRVKIPRRLGRLSVECVEAVTEVLLWEEKSNRRQCKGGGREDYRVRRTEDGELRATVQRCKGERRLQSTEYGFERHLLKRGTGDRKGGVTEGCSLTDATQSRPYPRAELAKEAGEAPVRTGSGTIA